jgi:tetratricopeptide (TPR) repeat protein
MSRRFFLVALSMLVSVTMRVDAQKIADEQSRREALDLFRAGQRLLLAEQFEKAADSFSKAIAKDGLLTVAHYGLGQADMNLRRFDAAAKAFEGCIEATRALHALQQTNQFEVEKRRDSEIREMRETIRVLEQSRRQLQATQAEQHLHDLENQRSSMTGPFRPPAEVLLALGSAHYKGGDGEAAEVEWKAATEANPKLGEAHNNLAVIYMQSDRLDAAEQELKLAEQAGFRVNPQFKEDLKKKKSGR